MKACQGEKKLGLKKSKIILAKWLEQLHPQSN